MRMDTDPYRSQDVSGGPSILVIDDEPPIRRLLGLFLQGCGYRTMLAANGVEARSAVATDSVSLILCDAHLQGESGLALVRDLLRQCPHMVGLIMSGDGHDSQWAAGLREEGIYGRIAKPFDAQEVADRIAKALCGRRLPEESPHRRDTSWWPWGGSGEGVIDDHTPDSAAGGGLKGST